MGLGETEYKEKWKEETQEREERVGKRGRREEKGEEGVCYSPSWLKSIFLKETRQYSFCEKGIQLYAKDQ